VNAARLELLQRMPVFGAVDESALVFLLGRARTVQVGRGSHFFREGEPASSMFVLESGAVEVYKDWAGHRFTVRRFDAGDCFGEMALLDLFPRSASVLALDECTAIEISSADLLQLYECDATQFALVQMNIAREMSRRLRATDEMLFRAWIGALPETAPAAELIYRAT
jgi:CRP-like cAMP-binding protein